MRTIVIIGASNVTLSLPVIWSTLTRSLQEPVRLMVTAGHGRSFGMPSTVFGRTLPSILECGLWNSLDQLDDASPMHAVVTDVGNDLLYGVDSKQIASWVNQTTDRLIEKHSSLVLTGLPIASLQDLSVRRFDFFRRLLFPQSSLTFQAALSEGVNLHHRILEQSELAGITSMTPEKHWYGFDPIHIRRRCRREAWNRYLSGCLPEVRMTSCGLLSDWPVWKLPAEQRWKKSRRLVSPQPVRVSNGNELWLF